MKKCNLIEDNSLGTHRVMFNGDIYNLKQYYVKFDELMFNPLNTRVKDKVVTHFPKITPTDDMVFSDEVQGIVYEALVSDHSRTINKKLKEKLSAGQTEPLIITESGVIISGNNRFSIIKSNIDEDEGIRSNFEKVIVAVIEGDLSPKQIIEWEISTQRETDLKLNYEEMNLIMRVKELDDSGTPVSKIMTLMSISEEKEIERYIMMANLYEKFLMYAGVPERYDLHRNISVYSYLDGLHSQLVKSTTKQPEKKMLPQIYFDVILGSELPVQKFRDLVGKLVGNSGIELEDRVKMLTYVSNSVTKELESTIEEIKIDSYSKEAVKKRKTLQDEEFANFFEKVSEKVNTTIDFKKNQKKSNFNSVKKQLEKAMGVYSQIEEIADTTIAYSYKVEEINSLKQTLNEHISKIEEISKKIK